ncbi:tRNA(Met) cytidine acetyltransferase [Natronospirillum operosum]|uniref:tRNA(Met) cytidine acetyltransferase n=1 Tax=Natronospirillum operosum TaxID=2759953 RepID=A0A4Z0W513_9GAMM|nr:GNAT family N-acetyltransferase [Natronospirillum operosum]TGG90638.1 tRNA(Met) cytidine acetyltransferase [Natronospirillum operosum]
MAVPTPDQTSRPALSRLPDRQWWLLEGDDTALAQAIPALAEQAHTGSDRTLWVTPEPDSEDNWPETLPSRQLYRLLGQTVDRLVLDWRQGWHLNHLTQAAGAVRAGGQLVILLNPDCSERFGWQPGQASNWFVHWRQAVLAQGARVLSQVAELPAPEAAAPHLHSPVRQPLTADQAAATRAIIDLAAAAEGSALVMTAARGHGKTMALLLAARALAHQGQRLTCLAPQGEPLRSLQSGWAEVTADLPAVQAPRFCTWDQWLAEPDAGDLVLADEAAMLGVSRLQTLFARSRRLVCATTTEGYEGSGQGFLLRFLPWLQQQARELTHVRLQQAIRWRSDDVMARALRQSLLYPVREPLEWQADRPQDTATADQLVIRELPLAQVVHRPEWCEDWVQLLATAHYQTRPDDLRQCIDNPDLLALGAFDNNRLVGLLVALHEPQLEPSLAAAIWAGQRRPPQQLAKQSLLGQLGHRPAAHWTGWRVWRLVVHPGWRRRGIARQLVQTLTRQAADQGADYLAAAFGLTPELLDFWVRADFVPVRLGRQPEAASGQLSLLMLRPLQERAAAFSQDNARLLGESVLLHPEQARRLEPEHTLLALARALPAPTLSALECERLTHWCRSHQPEASLQPILAKAWWACLAQQHTGPEPVLSSVAVRRLWWQQTWPEVQQALHLADRKAMQADLRRLLDIAPNGSLW